MKKIGVILSGCGNLDGAEIRESVFTLLAIDECNAEAIIMAPDVQQHHVLNFVTQKESQGEKRNVLVESARIARGKIRKLADVNLADLDALVLPGGFGVAKNLSTFAVEGVYCSVNEDVKKAVLYMVENKKPIGAICIAPAIVARILEGYKPTLTLGDDPAIAFDIEKTGAKHVNAKAKDIVIDEKLKLVTTPAYMDDSERLKDIREGISKCIEKVVSWIN